MYLFRRKLSKNRVAHIWIGDYPISLEGDTACKMWSTGGIRASFKKYMISPSPVHISKSAEKTQLRICHMCENNAQKAVSVKSVQPDDMFA